ncbi:MAG: GNAT family N-acetyltransferase [Bacteroidia bacterium]
MNTENLNIRKIHIRNQLQPGDIGHIIYLHGILYSRERSHGIEFESYVAGGLHEFYSSYNPKRERVWLCEHRQQIIGFLLLADRGHSAQLRYFLIMPEYRGIGLGNRLMRLYMDFMKECGYQSSFLWTTHELGRAAHLYQKYGFQFTEEIPSTAFGKTLREQRYDVVLKERRFLDLTNPKEIFEKLSLLRPDTLPRFGKMSAQHMVEHLTFVILFSYGKDAQTISVSKEEEERSKNFVVNTDKELPEGIMFPGMGDNLPPFTQPDLETAIGELKKALQEFHKHFSCDIKAQTVHPVLGRLNYLEWVKFHNKHFTHHFKQFNLL